MLRQAEFSEYMSSGHSTPDRIDRWLVKYCENFALSAGRCGYVYPPVGCFGQHVSECCPSEGTRVTWWEEAYTAEGTGPKHDKNGARAKEIYGFTKDGKGHADLKKSVVDERFEGDALLWKTCWRVPKDGGVPAETRSLERRKRREMGALRFRVPCEFAEVFMHWVHQFL